jgi:1,4-alpha-glucan branching enzyme
VLHAHLPYVRHPEYPQFLEEDWFFEALTETYVPLVTVLDGLAADGVDYRLTLTLSPTLLSMLADPLLIERYHAHLDRLVALAEHELARTARQDRQFHGLARGYLRDFERVRRVFRETYRSRLTDAFRSHRDSGRLEILTCAATHAVLPLLDGVPQAVRAQVLVGAEHHQRALGRAPVGLWLPECAYLPGHETFFREAGLRFSFLEAHGITEGHPRPSHGILAPIVSPGGVAFFGRDVASSRQVWSAEDGYPGDADYREFHKDVGWELPLSELAPFLGGGPRRSLGIKYHRVTGPGVDLGKKQPYDRSRALAKAARHAGHFLRSRQDQVRAAAGGMSQPPLVVSPYDAELFGHWWHEGPAFLDFLFRKLCLEQDVVAPITPSEFLDRHPDCEVVQPGFSTWGAKGYADVWLNPSNDWIYGHLDVAAERMAELARRHDNPNPLARRALNQAARELLLAQSSDWAFILKTGTVVEYARKRIRDHVARFSHLYRGLCEGGIDEAALREFEARDNLFPELDYRVYR